MTVPKRRPPNPHSASWLRSPARQRAPNSPSAVTQTNRRMKMVMATGSAVTAGPRTDRRAGCKALPAESTASATNRKRECRKVRDQSGCRTAPRYGRSMAGAEINRPAGISGAACPCPCDPPIPEKILPEKKGLSMRGLALLGWARRQRFAVLIHLDGFHRPHSHHLQHRGRAAGARAVIVNCVGHVLDHRACRHRIGVLGVVMVAGAYPPGARDHI